MQVSHRFTPASAILTTTLSCRAPGYLIRALRLFQGIALGAIIYLARFPPLRGIASLTEPYLLGIILDKTMTPGPTGGAIGYLFRNHDPGLSAKDIYRYMFSLQSGLGRVTKAKWDKIYS